MSHSSSGNASVFPLPLTAFERFMLADDTRQYPMIFFIEIGVTGNLKRTEFESAWEAAIERHALLAANIRRSWLSWKWKAASTAPVIQWSNSAPAIPSPEQRQIDLKCKPGLRVWVEHGSDQSRILFQFHHAATDGIGAIQFIGDVLAAYGCATAENEEERPQIVPVDPERLKIRGERWQKDKAPPRFIRRWLYRVFEVLSVHPCSVLRRTNVTDSDREGRPLFLTRFLERREVNALNSEATRLGVTSNELLALAMFQALYAWNTHHGRNASQEVFRIALPATVRTPMHDDCPAANIVSYILLTCRGCQIEDTASLLKFIAAESRQVLNGRGTGLVLLSIEAACLLPGVMWLLRLPLRLATTVLANVGDVKRQLRNRFPLRLGKCVAGNVSLDYLWGAAPVRRGTHVATSVGKYAGRLIINLNCDPHFFTADEAEEFADSFLNHLRQLYERSATIPVPESSVISGVERVSSP